MSGRCYVDNAYNRRVGRVGKPIGSHVISRGSSSGCSRSSSCSSSSSTYVSGYTRCDGTYVAPHTRSIPNRSGSRSTCSNASDVVYVNGYTRSDGTYVAPYTRSKQGACGSSYSSAAVVEPYTWSEPTSQEASHVYVDNAYNRKLGRVGKPIGTHVVSRTSGSDTVHYYSVNPDVQCLDRVGKPIPKQRTNIGNSTIVQVQGVLERMAISDESRRDLASSPVPLQKETGNEARRDREYSRDYLQQQEVEESWSKSGIKPSTDIPYSDSRRASQNRSQFKLIPYEELVLKKEIGRGGFGTVMEGLWHNTTVAFKKLHYSRMSKKNLDSFLSEVTILSSLNHPHTVKLFGAVADNSCVGFVMEYLRRSLFKAIFVDECEFTDDKKKGIVSQIADALVYLHDDKRIAHCDIKSENILLDSSDVVKLADFGLSTMKSATQTTQSVVQAWALGTPRYSAPEVLRGDLLTKSQRFPTDMYSLAMVVFEVMVEEEPFNGLNLKQLEKNVGYGDCCPTSENTPMDESVEKLLHECWDRVASKRPKAKEFQEKWRYLMAKDLRPETFDGDRSWRYLTAGDFRPETFDSAGGRRHLTTQNFATTQTIGE